MSGRRPGLLLVGLTGGIATGKSTAAACFARAGARVIDADALARAVVAPGQPALREIRREFGDQVLRADGSLDRAALAARVFDDPAARQRLNRIVHPRVERQVARELERIRREEPDALVVYDVPLLYETGIEDRFDSVVVVAVPRAEQLRRLAARDGLGPEEGRARLAAQLPVEEKAARADVVLDNTGSIAALQDQVDALVRRLRAQPGKRA